MRRRTFLCALAGGLGLRPATTPPLVKGSGPHVYLLEDGKRRWVPDPETFFHLWQSWNQVQEVADEVLAEIPLGPPLPSVLRGASA